MEDWRSVPHVTQTWTKVPSSPPYYFVDRDGDGLMESRINGRGAEPRAPQWVILSW